MILKKDKVFTFWIILLFAYLFIKMQEQIGNAVISLYAQNLFLTVLYILGIVCLLIFKKNKINKTTAYAIIFTLFSLCSSLFFSKLTFYTIINQTFWLLVLLISCNISNKDEQNKISTILMIAFIINVLFILINSKHLILSQINSIYYIVLLFPVLFLFKNKYFRIVLTLITFYLVIISTKRVAFLVILSISILPVAFTYKYLNNFKKVRAILLVFIIIVIALFSYNEILEYLKNVNIWNRLTMLSEDGGSGRMDIYKSVILGIKNSNFINICFGHGFLGVYVNNISTTSAHNDFLEIMYDYGIFGLISYIVFIINWFKNFYLNAKGSIISNKMFISSLIIFIFMSTFSHLIIYPTYYFYLIIIISLFNNKKVEK